jgi:hypothetical protein
MAKTKTAAIYTESAIASLVAAYKASPTAETVAAEAAKLGVTIPSKRLPSAARRTRKILLTSCAKFPALACRTLKRLAVKL